MRRCRPLGQLRSDPRHVRHRPPDRPDHRSRDLRRRHLGPARGRGGGCHPRRAQHAPRRLLRPVARRRAAGRLRPPIRDRHGGAPGAALHRGEPRGARHRRQGRPGQLVAHRRHLPRYAGHGLHPPHARGARRGRRHHVGQPAGRVRRARRTGARHVRLAHRHPSRPVVRGRRGRARRLRVGRHVAREAAAGAAPRRADPSRDGAQRPLRQPPVHPDHLRAVRQRERGHPGDAVPPLRQAGVHVPLPVARRLGRVLGQPGPPALRTGRLRRRTPLRGPGRLRGDKPFGPAMPRPTG